MEKTETSKFDTRRERRIDTSLLEPRRQGIWTRSRGYIYAYDLRRTPPQPSALPGEVCLITRPLVPALAIAMGNDAIFIEPRLATGRRCYAYVQDSQIQSYCWVAYDAETIGAIERKIVIEPPEAYIFDCATLPAFRGRGLYPFVLGQILRELTEQRISLAWIGVDADNIASQRGITKAGFVRVGETDYLRLGSWQRLQIKADPAAPLSLVKKLERALSPESTQ